MYFFLGKTLQICENVEYEHEKTRDECIIGKWYVLQLPNTASQQWIVSRAGQKPFQSLTLQQRQCHAPYSLAGFHALAVHRP
jgi:hypothetical protein